MVSPVRRQRAVYGVSASLYPQLRTAAAMGGSVGSRVLQLSLRPVCLQPLEAQLKPLSPPSALSATWGGQLTGSQCAVTCPRGARSASELGQSCVLVSHGPLGAHVYHGQQIEMEGGHVPSHC